MTPGQLANSSAAPTPYAADFSRSANVPPALRALPSIDTPFRVLVVEGATPQDTLLADVVHAELPDADILRTAGALGALAMAHVHSFDLLVLDAPMGKDLQVEL